MALIAAGFGVDGTSITLDALNNLQMNKLVALQSSITPTTVLGSSGSYSWTQPIKGSSWNKVIIHFAGYSSLSTSVLTFPSPFSFTPAVVTNGSGLSLGSLTATALTIPLAVAASGFVILEGF